MKAIDQEIYDILNEYLFDISKVGYFKNERGIEIASFDDNSSNYKIYMELLKKIGFERVYLNELNGEEYLMSKKYLCSISFCETDNELWLVYYKNIKEYLREKQEAILYYKGEIEWAKLMNAHRKN